MDINLRGTAKHPLFPALPISCCRAITYLCDRVGRGQIAEKDLRLLFEFGIEGIGQATKVIEEAGESSMSALIDHFNAVDEAHGREVIHYLLDARHRTESTVSTGTFPPPTRGSFESKFRPKKKGRQAGNQCPGCRRRKYRAALQSHVTECLLELRSLSPTSNVLIACGYCNPTDGLPCDYQGKAFGYGEYVKHIEDEHSHKECMRWDFNTAMNNVLTHDRLQATHLRCLSEQGLANHTLSWSPSQETAQLLEQLQTFAGDHTPTQASPMHQEELERTLYGAYQYAAKIEGASKHLATWENHDLVSGSIPQETQHRPYEVYTNSAEMQSYCQGYAGSDNYFLSSEGSKTAGLDECDYWAPMWDST